MPSRDEKRAMMNQALKHDVATVTGVTHDATDILGHKREAKIDTRDNIAFMGDNGLVMRETLNTPWNAWATTDMIDGLPERKNARAITNKVFTYQPMSYDVSNPFEVEVAIEWFKKLKWVSMRGKSYGKITYQGYLKGVHDDLAKDQQLTAKTDWLKYTQKLNELKNQNQLPPVDDKESIKERNLYVPRTTWAEGLTVYPDELAAQLINRYGITFYNPKSCRMYINGLWIDYTDGISIMNTMVRLILTNMIHYDACGGRKGMASVINEVVTAIVDLSLDDNFLHKFDATSDLKAANIQTADGVFNPITWEWKQSTPDLYIDTPLPYHLPRVAWNDLDKVYKDPQVQNMINWLKELFGEKDEDFLNKNECKQTRWFLTWLGSIPVRKTNMNRRGMRLNYITLLYSRNGGYGKSAVIEMVQHAICGVDTNRPDIMSAQSLQRLADDKYATSALMGTNLNVAGELDYGGVNCTSILKSITGGDAITAERKYQPSVTTTLHTTLLFSSNHKPTLNDTSEAMRDREACLPFMKKVAGDVKFMKKYNKNELYDDIDSEDSPAMQAIKKTMVIAFALFHVWYNYDEIPAWDDVNPLEMSEAMIAETDAWHGQASPVKQFLSDNFEYDAEAAANNIGVPVVLVRHLTDDFFKQSHTKAIGAAKLKDTIEDMIGTENVQKTPRVRLYFPDIECEDTHPREITQTNYGQTIKRLPYRQSIDMIDTNMVASPYVTRRVKIYPGLVLKHPYDTLEDSMQNTTFNEEQWDKKILANYPVRNEVSLFEKVTNNMRCREYDSEGLIYNPTWERHPIDDPKHLPVLKVTVCQLERDEDNGENMWRNKYEDNIEVYVPYTYINGQLIREYAEYTACTYLDHYQYNTPDEVSDNAVSFQEWRQQHKPDAWTTRLNITDVEIRHHINNAASDAGAGDTPTNMPPENDKTIAIPANPNDQTYQQVEIKQCTKPKTNVNPFQSEPTTNTKSNPFE